MNELTPRLPARPLLWPDSVLELQTLLEGTESYLVGGAVRDAYLHRPVKDIDLVTTPANVRLIGSRLADNFGGSFYMMDKDRHVGRAAYQQAGLTIRVDIAAYRGATLPDDLRDRDFTLNAMAVDVNSDLTQLIDPLGGEADIRAKVIRRCSPDAIASDVIRALRAIRMAVQFGSRIEAETLRDVRAHSGRLWETSGERIRDELFKMLDLPKPATVMRVAETAGVLTVIFPALRSLREQRSESGTTIDAWTHTLLTMDKLTTILTAISPARTDNTAASFEMGTLIMQLDRFRTPLLHHLNKVWLDERSHRSLLMLAALLHQTDNDEKRAAAQAVAAAEDLRLSGGEVHLVRAMIEAHHHPALRTQPVTALIAHRYWYALKAVGVDAVLISAADFLAQTEALAHHDNWLAIVERIKELYSAYFEHYDTVVEPPLLMNGTEIQQRFHLGPGRKIGQLLTQIREAQVTGAVRTVDEAAALIQQIMRADPGSRGSEFPGDA